MSFKCIDVRRDGAVEHLVLNRPDVRNAFDDEMIREMTWWADSVAADRGVRIVVISGAGPAFCAGADMRWMSRVATFTRDQNMEDATQTARLFLSIDRLPIPVIAPRTTGFPRPVSSPVSERPSEYAMLIPAAIAVAVPAMKAACGSCV